MYLGAQPILGSSTILENQVVEVPTHTGSNCEEQELVIASQCPMS